MTSSNPLRACPECRNLEGTPHEVTCPRAALQTPPPAPWVRRILEGVIVKRRVALEQGRDAVKRRISDFVFRYPPVVLNDELRNELRDYHDELRKTEIRIRELEEVEVEILDFLNL